MVVAVVGPAISKKEAAAMFEDDGEDAGCDDRDPTKIRRELSAAAEVVPVEGEATPGSPASSKPRPAGTRACSCQGQGWSFGVGHRFVSGSGFGADRLARRKERQTPVLIWVADRPERNSLRLPAGARAETVPRRPTEHPDLAKVEVLIPPFGSRAILEALPLMSGLRLIQTLESGVDWLLPHVPDRVALCNSRGTHDAAVAEWVAGVVLAMQRRLPEHLWAQRARALAEGRIQRHLAATLLR